MSSLKTLTSNLKLVVRHFIRVNITSKHAEIKVPGEIQNLVELFARKCIGCSLLTDEEDRNFIQLLSTTKFPDIDNKEFQLLYKASDNNWSAEFFHDLCDNKGATITIIQNDYGNIFGGYTSISWTSDRQYKSDPAAVLFTIRQLHILDKDQDNQIQIIELCSNLGSTNQSVYHGASSWHGPVFGNGFDIQIVDKCNNYNVQEINKYNYVLPSAFDHENLTIWGKEDFEAFNAHAFKIKDYHVFAVVDLV